MKDIDGPRGNRKNAQEATASATQDAPAPSEVTAPESVGQADAIPETAKATATATDDKAGKEAAVPAEKPGEEPKAEEVRLVYSLELSVPHADYFLVRTQAPSLWTTEAEAQVTPLFENNSDKLVEFKAFVEAGPAAGQAKDKRTFVTHVRPDSTEI